MHEENWKMSLNVYIIFLNELHFLLSKCMQLKLEIFIFFYEKLSEKDTKKDIREMKIYFAEKYYKIFSFLTHFPIK